MEQFSTIGRPVDLGYLTNRAIAIAAGVVSLASAVFQWMTGADLVSGGIWAISAGTSVFLAWALCRELDPDYEWSAFVAVGFALIGLIWGLPNLLVLFWVLLVMRVVNRTPGLPATWIDDLSVMIFSGWLVWDRGNWLYGLAAAVAFLLDGVMVRPNRKQFVFASVTCFATGAWLVLTGTWWGQATWSTASVVAMVVMVVFFLPVMVQSREMHSVGDRTNETLAGSRVQAAQILALSIGMQIGLWNGAAGVFIAMPLWAAVLGAAGYRFLIEPLLVRFSIVRRGEGVH